ncbi:MAG: NAD-dependent DNA ligase LigA [Deltaproteobacteria bacterium]|nr:NAD-dependent DNA ligase LigA [Deltaproteobacteria bacterium]
MDPMTTPPRPPERPVDALSVDELAQAVRYHNWRYFTLAEPEISDLAFDALTRRLAELAPSHPALFELVTDTASGEKVVHAEPMLSLDKCYDDATLLAWAKGFDGPVTQTPKIDGVAASLRYDARGRLVAAVTRGDGTRGESFLANAGYIDAIPKMLSGPPLDASVEVRGELYMPLSVFRALEGGFSNPRNTTAGAIKQKDPSRTAVYGLHFFAYDVRGPAFETEMEKVAWASAHGLVPVETERLDTDAMAAGYARWQARRDALDFEVDGVVYKADRLDEQARLGFTAHHPRFAIAYKFQGDSATSTLEEVQWSVSRTGTITPVGIIEPVELSGAMVSRCSLHNLAIVEQLGLSIGATVLATRRGGVIPHIESVVEPGIAPIVIPLTCPSCDEPTVVDGDFLRCSRPSRCPDVIRGTLEHFVKAVEIDGFGPKVVAQLVQQGLVAEPADFYRLSVEALMPLERMGETLAGRLVGNIQARRTLGLATFLRSLGIDDLGQVVSETLAQQLRTLDAVLAAEVATLEEIHGVGETIARSVVEGLTERRPMIDALLAEVRVEDAAEASAPAERSDDDPIAGRSFVFTGALLTMPREAAQKLVRERGGLTPSSVTKTLDYLVIGDKDSPLLGEGKLSTKHKAADRLVAAGAPLRIIRESEFQAMLDAGAGPA